MKYGIVKAAACSPAIKVGDPAHNAAAIVSEIKKLAAAGAELVVFPELCLSGYTAMDLFFTDKLLSDVVVAIKRVVAQVPDGMLAVFGAPVVHGGRLYNCAAVAHGGMLLGLVPKTELPEYGEFYERRYFTPNAFDGAELCDGLSAPIGNILFKCTSHPALTVGCEICEDMWTDVPPSVELCRAGATVIVNPSASDEVVGKADYRRLLVCGTSGKQHCGYVYADAGAGESTTDLVFSAHNIIASNGILLDESAPFEGNVAIADIDVQKLDVDRRKIGLKRPKSRFAEVCFSLGNDIKLERKPARYPFIPEDDGCAELILTMQSKALGGRFAAINAKKAVIGVSGGLDSALALLVCARALAPDRILPVTMPCFGTSDITLNSAKKLCAALGLDLQTVDIRSTVEQHLSSIDHADADVTYENAQARTRTMTLFDLANKTGGLVVGTGDLSELALGWCTFNGDHMASFGVNAGVPKTLVKHLVRYEAKRYGGAVKAALEGILGTDISPELLPPEHGKIAQKTEDILGKYDLLDFIIYYYCRYGFTREKIEFLLREAFSDVAESEIDRALDTFFKRFFASQFKRSCLPDGVKIGSVSFSPRGDCRLPSDL